MLGVACYRIAYWYFVVLPGKPAEYFGKTRVFEEPRGTQHTCKDLAGLIVETIVTKSGCWIAKYGDETGHGWLEYRAKSSRGLRNQGWKDSGDAIVNADESLAKSPIALVEVQGLVYMAKMEIAELYEDDGDQQTAKQLRHEARELRKRFNTGFWLTDKGIYSLALQKGTEPCNVISSNPGQALWTGIVDPEKAQSTVNQLMSEKMFSGWGIRTLSSSERRFNPVGHHLGTG